MSQPHAVRNHPQWDLLSSPCFIAGILFWILCRIYLRSHPLFHLRTFIWSGQWLSVTEFCTSAGVRTWRRLWIYKRTWPTQRIIVYVGRSLRLQNALSFVLAICTWPCSICYCPFTRSSTDPLFNPSRSRWKWKGLTGNTLRGASNSCLSWYCWCSDKLSQCQWRFLFVPLVRGAWQWPRNNQWRPCCTLCGCWVWWMARRRDSKFAQPLVSGCVPLHKNDSALSIIQREHLKWLSSFHWASSTSVQRHLCCDW